MLTQTDQAKQSLVARNWIIRLNHSRAVSRSLTVNHSRAASRALSLNHSRAISLVVGK